MTIAITHELGRAPMADLLIVAIPLDRDHRAQDTARADFNPPGYATSSHPGIRIKN
jgi:hypothetical protein